LLNFKIEVNTINELMSIIFNDEKLNDMYNTDAIFHATIETVIKNNLSVKESLIFMVKCLHESKEALDNVNIKLVMNNARI